MNVVFMGMKHCGKSTYGKALAEHWQCQFYDTDDLLSCTYQKMANNWCSVREIFLQIGEKDFKKLEAKIIERLHTELSHSTDHHVISMGGGLPINPALNTLLPDLGLIVYLQNDADVLFERIMNSGKVPFLDQNNPRMDFDRIYKERIPYYERYANLVLNLENMSIDKAKAYVIKNIDSYIEDNIYNK